MSFNLTPVFTRYLKAKKGEIFKMQESQKVMLSKVDTFNKKHSVGSSVTVIDDFGEQVETEVKHPAQILSGHTAVVWLNGISGSYLLSRVIA